MSAAGRNLPEHARRADDFYATPAWTTRAILPHLAVREGVALDPCCGEGAILAVLREAGMTTVGIEIDLARQRAALDRGHLTTCADALAMPGEWPDAQLLVTNPPYVLAEAFIARALDWVARHQRREVAFLLRLNFLGSQKRAAFHRAHPADVFVLPKRPSFAHGGTDATEYCWMVWGEGRGNRWFILDLPLAEARKGAA